MVLLSLATDSNAVMEARWFGEGDRFMEEMGDSRFMDVIYHPEINEYNGHRSIQLMIRQYRFTA